MMFSKSHLEEVSAIANSIDAYSVETNRHDSNVNVSALDLHETYLPAFQACVAAGAAQIMCAYNQINGLPACLHGDLQNALARGTFVPGAMLHVM